MKVSELRIGNLVYNDLAELKKVSGMDIAMLEQYPERAHGIPLTEEWLLRLGWERNGYWSKDYTRNSSVMTIKIVESLQGGFITEYYFSPLKHVHRLQNLYFALTGEELVITNM